MASIISITRGDPTVVNRYLADQLGEAERLAFEEEMLRDPEVLKEVEATARFKAGLMQLRATGELAALQAPGTARLRLAFAAAAVLAMLVIGLGVQQWQGGGSRMLLAGVPDSLQIGQRYALLSTRSDETDVVIDLPVSRQAIALRVLPDAGDAQSRYRVSLSGPGADAARASSVEGLQPGPDGFLTLYLDSARLTPGLHRMVVELESRTEAAAAIDTFTFRVRKVGAGP